MNADRSAERWFTRHVISLDDDRARDPMRAGGKAAALARLRAAGWPVDGGVVIVADDDREAMWPPPNTVPDGAARLIASLVATLWPGDLPPDPTVAVRSSSPAEDTPLASAAGRFLTVLGVPLDGNALVSAVHRVIASGGAAPIAVLIQPMIDAHAAGVAFGADPVTGDRDTVLIHAVRGLADQLMDGAVTGEQWALSGAGNEVRLIESHDVLTLAQAREIAHMVVGLNQDHGGPQDVEWAIDADGLHLVQCRPITALPTAPSMDLGVGTWVCDRHRYPDGMTPFGISIAQEEVSAGLTAVFRRGGALIDRVEMKGIAGRPYLRFVPVRGDGRATPPGPILGALARVVPALRRRCRTADRLLASQALHHDMQQWETELKPALRRRTDALLAIDLAALTDAALAAHLDSALTLLREGLRTHFRLMLAHSIGVYTFVSARARSAGLTPAQTLAGLAALTGGSGSSGEPTRALEVIAEHYIAGGGRPDVVPESVEALPGDIAAELAGWSRLYGERTANDDPGSPTLAEIPGLMGAVFASAVLRVWASVGGAEDGPGPRGGGGQVHGDGSPHPHNGFAAPIHAIPDGQVATARRAYGLREDNVLWATSRPSGVVRRALVEIGRRLADRGVIEDARSIVMADVATVRAAAGGNCPPERLRAVIARATAERAWVAAHELPTHIGPRPAPPPDVRWLPRAARIVNAALMMDRPGDEPQQLTGERAAEAVGGTADGSGVLLSGVGASAGRYTGPVRVITSPDGFATLREGEVLVCPVTDPAWSVLFAVAGAVVTDGGGILAHTAIIAREYGIPAVLATGSATSRLADGHIITVDGTTGLVHPGPPSAREPSGARVGTIVIPPLAGTTPQG